MRLQSLNIYNLDQCANTSPALHAPASWSQDAQSLFTSRSYTDFSWAKDIANIHLHCGRGPRSNDLFSLVKIRIVCSCCDIYAQPDRN